MQTTKRQTLRTLAGALTLTTSLLAVAATMTLTMTASAHEQVKTELFSPGVAHAAGASDQGEAGGPPLYEGLGTIAMTVTTGSAQAQAYFDQGLRLAWGFNHAEARRSFQEAQRLDPECAMCFWGEAFVLGPNINDAMHDEAVAPARQAIDHAMTLRTKATGLERALIEALAERYSADPMASRPALDEAWAEAMEAVAAAYPDDANVLVLYADALMNLQPWDYWEADGLSPKGHGGEIVAVLERALELDSRHPAAAHLYIHAVEASADPGRAETVADTLRGAAPAAGHLTHMPAHIYARIGRYGDSIAVNRDAIAADEAFLKQAGDAASALYRFGYYPHNVHYLLVSAQMAGVREDVIAAAERLAEVTSDEVSEELAWVQAIKTAQFSAHAQFSDPDTILALASPGDRFPFVEGYWHYARGVAFALKGDVDAASMEAAAIEELITETDMSSLEEQYLPARDVLAIARYVVEARIAQARHDYAAAEQKLIEAIRLEEGISYMEPPYWYYPVRQTLGAVLLQQGQAENAVAAFEGALAQMPRNGWALWGLVRAKAAAGDEDLAEAEAAFAKAWLGDLSLLSLDRL